MHPRLRFLCATALIPVAVVSISGTLFAFLNIFQMGVVTNVVIMLASAAVVVAGFRLLRVERHWGIYSGKKNRLYISTGLDPVFRPVSFIYGVTTKRLTNLQPVLDNRAVHVFDHWWFERAMEALADDVDGGKFRKSPSTSYAPYYGDPALAVAVLRAGYKIRELREIARQFKIPELEVAAYANLSHAPVEMLGELMSTNVPVEYAARA